MIRVNTCGCTRIVPDVRFEGVMLPPYGPDPWAVPEWKPSFRETLMIKVVGSPSHYFPPLTMEWVDSDPDISGDVK